jgi:hypothetical protein
MDPWTFSEINFKTAKAHKQTINLKRRVAVGARRDESREKAQS